MNNYTVEQVINDNGIQYRWCVKDSNGKNYFPKINSKDCAMKLSNSLRREEMKRNER